MATNKEGVLGVRTYNGKSAIIIIRRLENMSDKTFEWSFSAVTILAIGWIVAGIVMHIMHPAWVVIVGLILWLVFGGALLRIWGKDYMERER
jgi:hypothetical protein